MIEISGIKKGITYRGSSNPSRRVLELLVNRIGKSGKRVKIADRQTDVEYVFVNEGGEIISQPIICMASTFARWAIEPLDKME